MAELINGKELAEKMQAEIAEKIQKLKDNGIHPGLVVLLVGENPASQIYVRNKERVAKEIGIHSLVEPGAVVIDVGMNRDANGKLIGDVKFDEVEPVAGWITPVPKGVGPMTITMLMYQTVKSAEAFGAGE